MKIIYSHSSHTTRGMGFLLMMDEILYHYRLGEYIVIEDGLPCKMKWLGKRLTRKKVLTSVGIRYLPNLPGLLCLALGVDGVAGRVSVVVRGEYSQPTTEETIMRINDNNSLVCQTIEVHFQDMERRNKQEWNDYYMSEEYADEILALLENDGWEMPVGQA